MNKRIVTLFVVAGGLMAAAFPAEAQMLQWTDRVFVSINGAYQNRSDTSVTVGATETVYDETATYGASQTVTSKKGFFDVSGGIRVIGNLGVGVGFTQISTTGSADGSATVPHPLFYNSPRSATASLSGLEHKEQQVHVFAMFVLPLTEKFEVAVFGGPTFFKLDQATIGDFSWSETAAPYSSINLTMTGRQISENKTGVNVGADVTFKFMKNLGVGGFIRYAAATVPVTADDQTFDVNVGGIQAGGGVRIRF